MRCLIALGFVVVMLVGGGPAVGGDKLPPTLKQLRVSLRLLEGDPLGSREAGTLKVLAEPCLVTGENRSFSFASGGEVAVPDDASAVQYVYVGRMFEGKTGAIEGGKVRLDFTLSSTTPGEGKEERTQFHTESTRTITTVKLGEVVKFRWGKGSADKQTWLELSMEEVKP